MTAVRSLISPRVAFWSSVSVIATVYVLGVLITSPLFSSLLHPLVQVYSIALPVFAAVVALVMRFARRYAVSMRNVSWQAMPADIEELARRMDVRQHINKYGEHDHLDNAFTDALRGRVVIGRKLRDRLSVRQAMAVVAHEFAHVRQANRWTRFPFIAYYAWAVGSAMGLFLGWHPIIQWPPVLALNLLLLCSLHWRMEYDADRNSANYVDPGDLADALEALQPDLEKRSYPSPLHPPISWRVKRLRKLSYGRAGDTGGK